MIKPLKKRGRPRTRKYNDANVGEDGIETENKSKESKRASRPPKNLDDDYDFSMRKRPRREVTNDKLLR